MDIPDVVMPQGGAIAEARSFDDEESRDSIDRDEPRSRSRPTGRRRIRRRRPRLRRHVKAGKRPRHRVSRPRRRAKRTFRGFPRRTRCRSGGRQPGAAATLTRRWPSADEKGPEGQFRGRSQAIEPRPAARPGRRPGPRGRNRIAPEMEKDDPAAEVSRSCAHRARKQRRYSANHAQASADG